MNVMETTTITIDKRVRERLKSYGTSGMNYSKVLTALMDEVEKQHFIQEWRRRMDDPEYPWEELDLDDESVWG